MGKCAVSKLRELQLFNNIEDANLYKLSEFVSVKRLKKGEHLFRDKDEVKNFYIVSKGKVALYKLSESAQKKVVFILGENNIINAVIIDNLPASINCEAFEDSEILSFERERFIEVMRCDFELTKEVINSLSNKVRRLYRQSKNSVAIKVEKKLAAKLWKLSKDYGVEVKEGTLIDLNITITYLAEMFGIPRETISRSMKILVDEKLIVINNKRIIVCDRDRLAKFFKCK